MSAALDLRVLRYLALGRTLVWTGQQVDLVPRDVVAVARKHYAVRADGSVDPAMCGHAAAELEAKTGARPRQAGPAPAATAQTLRTVPIGQVKVDPDNVRQDVGDVTELAASIREVGMLQPIVCRTSARQLFVVAGHRRLAAAKLLRWAEITVIVHAADMRPADVVAAMLVENSHRRDLDPIEEARGLARLQALHGGISHAQLAAKIGRTQVHVSARLALLSLSPADQDAVRAGAMTLVEATYKARAESGRTKPKGQDKGWHLGPAHRLAQRAKARCQQSRHPQGRRVGGMACGECWEGVIRADERHGLHAHSAKTGACALCDHPIPNREDQPA